MDEFGNIYDALADYLIETYYLPLFLSEGRDNDVKAEGTSRTQEDNKTDSRKRRNDSILIGSKGTSGNTP